MRWVLCSFSLFTRKKRVEWRKSDSSPWLPSNTCSRSDRKQNLHLSGSDEENLPYLFFFFEINLDLDLFINLKTFHLIAKIESIIRCFTIYSFLLDTFSGATRLLTGTPPGNTRTASSTGPWPTGGTRTYKSPTEIWGRQSEERGWTGILFRLPPTYGDDRQTNQKVKLGIFTIGKPPPIILTISNVHLHIIFDFLFYCCRQVYL